MNGIQPPRVLRPAALGGVLSWRSGIPAGAAVGLAIGVLLFVAGPALTVAVVAILAYAWVLFKAPEFAILLLLVFTSGLLPGEFNPSYDLLVGHFQLADLILISLLAIIAVRLLVERDFRFRAGHLSLPLVLFFLTVVGGMITAIVQHGVPFRYTTYEARILLYYSAFFAAANLIRTPRQARRLVAGIFVIGVVVAARIVVEIGLGYTISTVLPVYLKADLLARPYHPGFIAIYMTIMALICSLAFDLRPRWKIAVWAAILLLAAANIISLGRNIIVSSVLAFLALLYALSAGQRRTWLKAMLVLLILAVGLYGILQLLSPTTSVLAYSRALAQRLSHFFSAGPLSPEETLLWRVREATYARQQLTQSVLLGIGPSVSYRPAFSETDTMQQFIHNGYLWLWLKTGLLGLVTFLWFLIAFLRDGFRKWAEVQDTLLRAAAIGFTLVILALMFSNLVAPLFVENFNLAFLAAGMGVVEAVFALERETS